MKTPTIHLNGTSRDELRDQNLNARRAVAAAFDALEDAAPNARDYYPQGDSAFNDAAKEHAARVAALRKVLGELNDIADAIEDAP